MVFSLGLSELRNIASDYPTRPRDQRLKNRAGDGARGPRTKPESVGHKEEVEFPFY